MTLCPLCKGDVPEDAKKCKHCGEWLSRKHAYRQGLWAVVPLIVFVSLMIALPNLIFRNAFGDQAQFHEHRGDLVIQEHSFHISDTGIPYVLGKLVNVGAIPWKSISIRADFHDTSGRAFDTAENHEFAALYPGDSRIFKIRVCKPVLHARYDSYAVCVESADDHRGPF